jgi:hypothetical protein
MLQVVETYSLMIHPKLSAFTDYNGLNYGSNSAHLGGG